MSFWDSSAILPLLVDEPASRLVREMMRSEEARTVWWGSLVECHSALERRTRSGQLSGDEKRQALQWLRQLARVWHEIVPTTLLRDRAVRLLALHDLRAADSLQLAAALVWSGEQPHGRAFVCLDTKLRGSAEQEGFTVLPETLSP